MRSPITSTRVPEKRRTSLRSFGRSRPSSAFIHEPAIDLERRVRHARHSEACADARAAGGAESRGERDRPRRGRSPRRARPARPGGTRIPVSPSATASGTPPTRLAITGRPRRHRLERGYAESFLKRRHHRDVRGGEQRRDVVDAAEEADDARQPERLRQRVSRSARLVPLARAQHVHARVGERASASATRHGPSASRVRRPRRGRTRRRESVQRARADARPPGASANPLRVDAAGHEMDASGSTPLAISVARTPSEIATTACTS